LLALSSAHAAIRTWDGDTSTSWGASGNWDTGVPGTADTANFNLPGPYGSSSTPRNPTVGAATTIAGITIGASNGAMTLTTGGYLTIGSGTTTITGISIANGAGAFTISGQTTIGVTQYWINDSTNLFTFGAVNTNGKWLDVSGSGNSTTSGIISGSGGLTRSGTGKLTIGAANTYTADTTVNGGTLAITGSGQICTTVNAAKSNWIKLNNGTIEFDNWQWGTTGGSFGTLQYQAANLVINGGTLKYVGTAAKGSSDRAFTIGASGATLESATSGQTWTLAVGGYTLTSSLGGTLTLTGAGDGQIDKAIPGTGGLAKSGNGTWTLAGANTYTGTTTATAGALVATKAAALPGYNVPAKVIFNGGTVGAQVGGSGWATADADTLLTNATKTSGAFGIDTTNGSLIQWTAFTTTNLGSNLGLTKLGANTLTMDQANTYAGATTIKQGTLKLGANDVLPDASPVSIGTATLDADTRTDTVGTLNVTNAASAINLGSLAALAFANSSGVNSGTWSGTLHITGTFVPGNGVDPGVSTNPGSLRFGTDGTGLTTTQLASITASGWTGFTLDAYGYLTATPTSGPGLLDHFAISAIGSPQTVGTPITGITLTAQDASNQTVTSFSGTVTFSGTGGFSGTSAPFSFGVLSDVSVTPANAGSDLTLVVTDLVSTKTGSQTITTIQTAVPGGAPLPLSAHNTIYITATSSKYSFVNNDFAFHKSTADTFAGVIITSLPIAGTLTYNNIAVNQADVTQGTIFADRTKFTFNADINRTPTSFSFKLKDSTNLFTLLNYSVSIKYNSPVSKLMRTSTKNYIDYKGLPYLNYGIQLRIDDYLGDMPSNPSKLANVYQYFEKAKLAGFRDVLVPIRWSDIETADNTFNFTLIDAYLANADTYNLRLQFLWFGSDICGYSDVPGYISNNPTDYPLVSTIAYAPVLFTTQSLIEKETRALTTLMDYLAVKDTNKRVVLFQVENEPDHKGVTGIMWGGGQKAGGFNMLDTLGQVIHSSGADMVTRVNLTGWTSDASDIGSLKGINIVGLDVYTDGLTSSQNNSAKFDYPWNANHTPENGAQYKNVINLTLAGFEKGFGYLNYELRTTGGRLSDYDLGLYRGTTGNDWIERDGSQMVPYSLNKTGYRTEVNMTEVKNFNEMIYKADKRIAKSPKGKNAAFNLSDAQTTVNETKTFSNYTVTYTSSVGGEAFALEDENGDIILMSLKNNSSFTFQSLPANRHISIGYFDEINVWHQTGSRSIIGNNVTLNAKEVALLTSTVYDGYSAWIGSYAGLADATPLGDPDHDGILNLMEYVLNGNPTVASTDNLPVLSKIDNNFVFSFSRRQVSAQDTTQIFQYSSDLSDWTDVNVTGTLGSQVTIGTADSLGVQSVMVTIPQGSSTRMFGRLKVTQP